LQLFAVLFFIMLYVLGVGSAVALMGSIITIIRDSFPNLKYLLVAVVACVLGFVGGLVYVTPVSK
jgi:solute carrier family 6 amino acid transporter-like protein 5/7/9/14